MNKKLRKTIVYTETLEQDGTSVASLRGTVDTAKVGQYSVNCTILDKSLYESHMEEVQADEDEFTEILRAEANSGNDETVISETAPVEESEAETTKSKSSRSTKK